MGADVLSDRELNRATLARQLLLERVDLAPRDAIERLVGLQAQEPPDPYLALWSRLEGFDPDDVGRGLEDRTLVRIVVMRGTVHLVTADDAVTLRPLCQPVLDGELVRHSEFKDLLAPLDLTAIMATLRPQCVGAGPLSGAQIRELVEATYPDLDRPQARAVAWATRNRLDMVQTPPRGVWRAKGQVRTVPLDAWLGRPIDPSPSIDAVALRYLAAFGPASPADLGAWCRLTGMREVFDRITPELRPFRTEGGKELWDVPDAPRPHADTPAPIRFLPEYDNVLLSHADRSRFHWHTGASGSEVVKGTVLVDGVVRAVWRPTGGGLEVDTIRTLPKRAVSAVQAEGRRLLRFVRPDDGASEVRVRALD